MTESKNTLRVPEVLDLPRTETDHSISRQDMQTHQLELQQTDDLFGLSLINAVRDALPASRLTTELTARRRLPLCSPRRLLVTAEIPVVDELRQADIYSSTIAITQKLTYQDDKDGPVKARVQTPCYVVGRTSRQALAVIAKSQVAHHLGEARPVADPILDQVYASHSLFEVTLGRRKINALDKRRYDRSISPTNTLRDYRHATYDLAASAESMVAPGAIKMQKRHAVISPELMKKYNVLQHLSLLAVRFSVEDVLAKNLSKSK